MPADFSPNIVQGKTYDLDAGTGRELFVALEERLTSNATVSTQMAVAEGVVGRMFSDPVLTRRRLGQGGFRILVTDTYDRQCAVTGEHTLPVLQAAHIKPVSQGGEHLVNNGLCYGPTCILCSIGDMSQSLPISSFGLAAVSMRTGAMERSTMPLTISEYTSLEILPAIGIPKFSNGTLTRFLR